MRGDRVAQLDSFGVARIHRRHGHGRELLRSVEALMRQRGVRRIDVVLRDRRDRVGDEAAASLFTKERYAPRKRLNASTCNTKRVSF